MAAASRRRHVALRHALLDFDLSRFLAAARRPEPTMQLNVLKAKIHRASVTHAELHYEGSCAIDGRLLDISGIREYEQIHIYNVNNGARFVTYAIRGEEGSGVISVNGAAAHCASPGDLVIICAYGVCDEAEAAKYKPTCVYVDRQNQLTHTNHSMPAQAAA
jgi:aspartate 1-decarboxylase